MGWSTKWNTFAKINSIFYPSLIKRINKSETENQKDWTLKPADGKSSSVIVILIPFKILLWYIFKKYTYIFINFTLSRTWMINWQSKHKWNRSGDEHLILSSSWLDTCVYCVLIWSLRQVSNTKMFCWTDI